MKKIAGSRRALVLWIGGVCFLAGSLVVGSIAAASAAAPAPAAPPAQTVNQGAPGPSAWPVSGTVNVAAPQRVTGIGSCNIVSPETSCFSSDLGLLPGAVLNTIGVHCEVPHGLRTEVMLETAGVTSPGAVELPIPLTPALSGAPDTYDGTVTNLGIPVPTADSPQRHSWIEVFGSSAGCIASVVGTSS